MTLFFVAPAVASATAPQPRLGDVVALVSGLCYGLLLIGFRWLGRANAGEASVAVAWGNVLVVPVALLLSPVFGQPLTLGDAESWVAIVLLGTLQVGLAYALVVRAVPHVPVVQTSLILMIEPALNPLWAFAVHGELPHWLAVAGGAVILAAIAVGGVLAGVRRRAAV
jgi:drug/metabolite transporter (DMT)-like permease